MIRYALVAGMMSASTVGCTADNPVKRPGEADAGTGELLDPPAIDPLPETTPLDTVAIRGNTDGSRVVTQAPQQTVITAVLPGGSFCQDAPLASEGATMLRVYAVGGDGRVSEPLEAEILRDPSAPEPAEPRCSGAENPDCAGAETCGNGADDDCNGWEDACDLTCSGCVDDEFEPNDFPFNVPTLLPGTYSLQLCPCRDDWLAFSAEPSERIHVTASFDPGVMNLNLRLYRAAPGGNGINEDLLQGSFSTTGFEEIDYSVEEAGTYYLRIYPLDDDKREGPYTLQVQ